MAELREIARVEAPASARWADLLVHLAAPALICAGYASGLVTHGAQLAPAGPLRLRSAPVYADEGALVLLADRAVGVRLTLEERPAPTLPEWERAPGCVARCSAREPREVQLAWRRHGLKAQAWPESGTIELDPDWWASVETTAARYAVLAHELGHLLGADCERCADHYAGQALALAGISYRDAVRGLDALVSSRVAADSLVRGYLHG